MPGKSADVDETMRRHQQVLDEVRAALTDLEISPSYLLLLDPAPGGETERRYAATAAKGREMWGMLEVADRRLGQADDLAGERDRQGRVRGRRADEVKAFLNARFDAGLETDHTLAELIDALRKRVAKVHDAAGEIETVWLRVLPRVDAARTTLDRLRNEAEVLGVTEPLIGRAQAMADDLQARLVADPVAVHPDEGANLDAQVKAAARQMAEIRTGHENLDSDLHETEELLASLRGLLAQAEAARIESANKVIGGPKTVRVPSADIFDGPNGLASRLDRLFDDAATTRWTQQRALLDRWLEAARGLERQLRRAEAANRAPLELRDELRGRLRALTAKMAGTGRAEDLEVDDLVQNTHSLLYTAPTELALAEAKLEDLAARLQT